MKSSLIRLMRLHLMPKKQVQIPYRQWNGWIVLFKGLDQLIGFQGLNVCSQQKQGLRFALQGGKRGGIDHQSLLIGIQGRRGLTIGCKYLAHIAMKLLIHRPTFYRFGIRFQGFCLSLQIKKCVSPVPPGFSLVFPAAIALRAISYCLFTGFKSLSVPRPSIPFTCYGEENGCHLSIDPGGGSRSFAKSVQVGLRRFFKDLQAKKRSSSPEVRVLPFWAQCKRGFKALQCVSISSPFIQSPSFIEKYSLLLATIAFPGMPIQVHSMFRATHNYPSYEKSSTSLKRYLARKEGYRSSEIV